MNRSFNHALLTQDLQAVRDFITKFFKSFGPSQKKIAGKPIPLHEEMYVRFRLMIVEMGITKVLRISIVTVVGIIFYFAAFRNAGDVWKIILGFIFASYVIWVFLDTLTKSSKDGSLVAGVLVSVHETRVGVQDSIFGIFSDGGKKK